MTSGFQPLETTVPIAKILKALKAVDPELRKQFMQQAKSVARPVESAIKSNIPAIAPLSGMNNNGRLGWGVGKSPQSTTVKFKGSASKKSSVTSLLSVQVNSPAVAVADMAGRSSSGNSPRGRALIRNLNAIRGASRFVYPGGESAAAEAITALKGIIDDVANYFNRMEL